MRKLTEVLDSWSIAVLIMTLILFILALFTKGLTHDLLLEGGVFLVSMKLMIMAYNNSTQTREHAAGLQKIQFALARIENRLLDPTLQIGTERKNL